MLSSISLKPPQAREGTLLLPSTRRVAPGPESFCALLRLSLWVAGPGRLPSLSDHRPWLLTEVQPVPPAQPPPRGPLTRLPPRGCPPGPACPGLPPRSQAAASTSHRCILGSWEAGSRKQRWPGSFSVPVPETATPNPFSLHMRKQAWVGDWPRSLPLPFTLKPPLLAPEAHWPSKSVFWFLLPH